MGTNKITSLLMAAALIFTMSACGGASSSTASASSAPSQPAATGEPSSAEASSMPQSLSGTVNQQPACVMPAAPQGERAKLKVAALKGPSAVGLLQLMERSDDPDANTYNQYEYTIVGAPDQLVGAVVKGEYDIAVLPTNLAATLYNKTEGKIKLATINTLGVLYVVQSGDSIKSVADLKGKTIYATAKGSTPEFVLNYVLEKNGLKVGTDVKVEYKTEHTELAALMAAGQAELALLPQPFVTTALAQNDKLSVALDMTEEWNKASKGESQLTMSGVVIQQKLIDENPDAVKAFLIEYANSTLYANEPINLDAVAELAVKRELIPSAAVAKKAIPQCNIVFISGNEMKQAAGGFLRVLFDANPQSVGGKLPDEGFYYIGEE